MVTGCAREHGRNNVENSVREAKMKRLLLGLMLLVTAGAASAEWTLEDFSVELIQYVDRATIRRNGNLVKMWEMSDYNTVQTAYGISFLSGRTQWEFDCNEETIRRLAFSLFNGKMSAGTNVSSNSDGGKWLPIQPGSVAETLWKIACGK